MADHRPDVYENPNIENGLIFRASSLSRCDESLAHAAIGSIAEPTPDFMQVAFDEGSNAEDAILQAFCGGLSSDVKWDAVSKQRNFGNGLAGTQWKRLDPTDLGSYHFNSESFPYCRPELLDDDQFTMEIPVGKHVVRGHLDDIGHCYSQPKSNRDNGVNWMSKRVVLEAKFLGPAQFKKWVTSGFKEFDYYAWQVSQYGIATGLDVLFIVGEKIRQEGQEPKLNSINVTWIKNSELPISMNDVKLRVFRLGKVIDQAFKTGEVGECEGKQYPCAFFKYHVDGKAGEKGSEIKRDAWGEVVEPLQSVGANVGVAAEGETSVELVAGPEPKTEPVAETRVVISNKDHAMALVKNAMGYAQAGDVEKKAKDMKAKAKENVDKILQAYRDKSRAKLVVKEGVEVDDKSGVFVCAVEFDDESVEGGKREEEWEIEWVHKFSAGGKPSVTSSRLDDSPKFKKVKG